MPKNHDDSDQKIFSSLKELLKKLQINIPPEKIRMDTKLIDELGVDSLKIAELSILLETSFHSTFFLPEILGSVSDPSELTVASLVKYIRERLE